MRLENKAAVVTGGASGIGRAIAIGFANEGAAVVVGDIDFAGAEETVREIEKAGGRALAVEADVAVKEQVEALINTAVENFGALNILVNAAGIFEPVSLLDCTVEQWDRTMAVDLKGVFFAVQAACRVMKDNGGGSIINISSNAAFRGRPMQQAYAAAKGGLRGLTGNVAVQMGEYGIRINNISPGWIDTKSAELDYIADEKLKGFRTAAIPLLRRGTPEDIVGPAVFLASDESAYMTGDTMVVDGGSSVYLSGIGDHVKSDY